MLAGEGDVEDGVCLGLEADSQHGIRARARDVCRRHHNTNQRTTVRYVAEEWNTIEHNLHAIPAQVSPDDVEKDARGTHRSDRCAPPYRRIPTRQGSRPARALPLPALGGHVVHPSWRDLAALSCHGRRSAAR